ncbi:hypothetical protein [Aliarcobacter cryaerophilus]|uniref:hypothetical protein n=1 Tax=Aliarcobacter cryaerophilus TaxID=28198 RepID=UPI0021B649FC|nr:hypothetical protein [Aliarcobacter cryaerophilus]MCT7531779.1 hypothetical protein [Aliarcobacter cryaerophilus]
MKNKLWTRFLLGLIILVLGSIFLFNYIIDPYGLYKTNFFPNKPQDITQSRMIKILKAKDINPASIVIGTSRSDMGFNPEHKYFQKPSYNLSITGSSIYETKYYIKEMILKGDTKEILMVIDWRMFNDLLKKVPEFETYFEGFNPYRHIINIQTLKDSYFTIKNQNRHSMYQKNGLLIDEGMKLHVKNSGGHLALMKKEEKFYYSIFPTDDNTYIGTKKSSFDDFRDILELAYANNIKIDIIFGPSHIRQWEAFSYYHDIENWYKWKKDVILYVEKVANEQHKKPFRVMDFSVYHKLTAETVPTNPKENMKYYWEAGHYKKELGDIVLDRLLDISPYKDFGVEVNSKNIDEHIQNLREDRAKFIDTKAYRKEVFGE